MTARGRRLPRRRAWPLTATEVTECLGASVERVTDPRFLTGNDGGTIVLGAAWVAPETRSQGRGVHPDSVGFHVDIHPADAADRAAIRAVLRAQGLPQLHEWIAQAATADENRLLTPHQRYWRLTDGRLTPQKSLACIEKLLGET